MPKKYKGPRLPTLNPRPEIQIPKRIPKNWLVNFDLEALTKLNTQQANRVLSSVQYQIRKARKSFRKENLVSPAYEAYFNTDEKKFPRRGASRQQTIHEIQRGIMFMRSKTSTVEGAKKYWEEQEKRIFGTIDKNGVLHPKETLDESEHLTEKQRKRFWAAYDEFMHQYKSLNAESSRIQQVIAQAGFWRYRSWNAEDFKRILMETEGEEIVKYGR